MSRPLRPMYTVTHCADPESAELVALAQPRHYGILDRPWYVDGIVFRTRDPEGRLVSRGIFYGHGLDGEKYDPLDYRIETSVEYYGRDAIDNRLGWHGPEMIVGAPYLPGGRG